MAMWQFTYYTLTNGEIDEARAGPSTLHSTFSPFIPFSLWSWAANDLCIGKHYGRALAGSAGATKYGRGAVGL